MDHNEGPLSCLLSSDQKKYGATDRVAKYDKARKE
jgi:hypothetical protein